MPPNKQQAITWTNSDQVPWRINAVLKGSVQRKFDLLKFDKDTYLQPLTKKTTWNQQTTSHFSDNSKTTPLVDIVHHTIRTP